MFYYSNVNQSVLLSASCQPFLWPSGQWSLCPSDWSGSFSLKTLLYVTSNGLLLFIFYFPTLYVFKTILHGHIFKLSSMLQLSFLQRIVFYKNKVIKWFYNMHFAALTLMFYVLFLPHIHISVFCQKQPQFICFPLSVNAAIFSQWLTQWVSL